MVIRQWTGRTGLRQEKFAYVFIRLKDGIRRAFLKQDKDDDVKEFWAKGNHFVHNFRLELIYEN